MTETARWKTIATIAVAFSLGNLFATACTTGGGDTAQASSDGSDGSDGASPPDAALEAEVAALRSEVDALKCFIGHMTDTQAWEPDYWYDLSDFGTIDWHQGPNSDASKAYEDCF